MGQYKTAEQEELKDFKTKMFSEVPIINSHFKVNGCICICELQTGVKKQQPSHIFIIMNNVNVPWMVSSFIMHYTSYTYMKLLDNEMQKVLWCNDSCAIFIKWTKTLSALTQTNLV